VTLQLTYGLVAQALIAAAAVRLAAELLLPRTSRKGPAPESAPVRTGQAARARERIDDLPRGAAWAIMAGPLVLLVPAGACTIAEHMRGIWGDPSAVTCALLAIFIARPGRLPPRPSRLMCIGLTLLVTVPLYAPLASVQLPLTDLYAIGWQPHALLMVIAASALLSVLARRWRGTWCIIVAIALLAYSVRIMESTNLLDYLADPGLLLTLAAMGMLPRARKAGSTPEGHATHE
jgi:hypothetical protein